MKKIATFDDWIDAFRAWQKDIGLRLSPAFSNFQFDAKYGELKTDEIEFGELFGATFPAAGSAHTVQSTDQNEVLPRRQIAVADELRLRGRRYRLQRARAGHALLGRHRAPEGSELKPTVEAGLRQFDRGELALLDQPAGFRHRAVGEVGRSAHGTTSTRR